MVASGNDFIVIGQSGNRSIRYFKKTAQDICDRKYGIGADGLLVLEKSMRADIRMRIFNSDGSEAKMCGNGARCIALWLAEKKKKRKSKLKIETRAGIIEAQVKDSGIKIKLTHPLNIKLDIPIKVNSRYIRVNFINTGVPHAVIFTEGLDKINIYALARFIRFHKQFAPGGANVNFVEILNNDSIKIRTYERGVEDETLACGTGSVASAIIFSLKTGITSKIKVQTKGREVLKVYFDRDNNRFNNVWLEGSARIVYKGEYYVNEATTYGTKRT